MRKYVDLLAEGVAINDIIQVMLPSLEKQCVTQQVHTITQFFHSTKVFTKHSCKSTVRIGQFFMGLRRICTWRQDKLFRKLLAKHFHSLILETLDIPILVSKISNYIDSSSDCPRLLKTLQRVNECLQTRVTLENKMKILFASSADKYICREICTLMIELMRRGQLDYMKPENYMNNLYLLLKASSFDVFLFRKYWRHLYSSKVLLTRFIPYIAELLYNAPSSLLYDLIRTRYKGLAGERILQRILIHVCAWRQLIYPLTVDYILYIADEILQ